ncbi:MAG: hypothetical protein M3O64_00575 [Chloroflexota bacterium]|nr:hypothetical protein [Chloroflexota bacterium]
MRASACLLALGLILLVAQPAAAAMWVRIDVAGPVAAGAPTKVTVTTLYLTQTLCTDDPQASPIVNGIWYSGSGSAPSEPSFRLAAYPAGRPGASTTISLTHRAVDSPYFDGTMTFPSAGTWTVRMVAPNWGGAESEAERCAGARIDVQVAPALAERAPWPWLGAAALFVALAVVLARSRPGRPARS